MIQQHIKSSLNLNRIKKCGDTYTIAATNEKVYYVSRIYEPSGRPPKFTIPFKSISIFSRLKAKAYTMNKVDMSRAGGAVHFRAIGSAEFIEWTWNKGTNFDIDTELGITDVYLSGFYLQKMPEDLIIIDADAKGKANLGLIQYIKGLIWPF